MESVLDGQMAYMQGAKAKLEGVARELMQLCSDIMSGGGEAARGESLL